MSLPTQRLLARLSGYANSRPVYQAGCDTAPGGTQRKPARLAGYVNGRPVYEAAACSLTPAGNRKHARLVGYTNGRPVYAAACCPVSGSGVTSSGGGPSTVIVPCSSNTCITYPYNLHVTFPTIASCDCLSGLSIPISWNNPATASVGGGLNNWSGLTTVCPGGCPSLIMLTPCVSLDFVCNPADCPTDSWQFDLSVTELVSSCTSTHGIYYYNCGVLTGVQSCNYNPFQIVFKGYSVGGFLDSIFSCPGIVADSMALTTVTV